MSKVVAVANRKGGVGKTTSTVNLAHALLKQGQRVLVVDVDPQCSLSAALGLNDDAIEELSEQNKTLYHSLVNGQELDPVHLDGAPDLIAASDLLVDAEDELLSRPEPMRLLAEKIDAVRDRYDVILLDCPPTRGFLTLSALAAADLVLIPVKTDFNSTRGIRLLFKTIEELKAKANPRLEPLGVLPIGYHPRFNHDREVLSWIKEEAAGAGVPVFDPVHSSTAYDKAALEGKSTLELWPRTPGVQVYCTIADKITSHG